MKTELDVWENFPERNAKEIATESAVVLGDAVFAQLRNSTSMSKEALANAYINFVKLKKDLKLQSVSNAELLDLAMSQNTKSEF